MTGCTFAARCQVDTMDMLFKSQLDEPPLYKNQPPVAGAIHWEKSLFHRIKHTIIRFLTLEEMMASEQGKAVRGGQFISN